MNKPPLVSVIIPCYNTANYLPETLDSLAAQTLSNFEIIAIDDGSTDNTLAVLHNYQLKEPRLRVLSQENTYCAAARANAISHAKGKYLVCLDSDDKLAPDYLKKCSDLAEQQPDLSIIYTNALLFGKENKPWKLPQFELVPFLITNCIYVTALIRKSHYDAVGGFDTQMTLLEDWELFISLIKNGGKVHRIAEPLFYYRKREDESSVSNTATKIKHSDNAMRIYTKHYEFYKSNGILFQDMLTSFGQQRNQKIKKYNGIFRKYFYKWFKPDKYQKISIYINQ